MTDFNTVSVEQIVENVSFMGVFINQAWGGSCHVRLWVLAEGWIKPDYVSRAVFPATFLLRCIVEVVLKGTRY